MLVDILSLSTFGPLLSLWNDLKLNWKWSVEDVILNSFLFGILIANVKSSFLKVTNKW